MPKYSYTVLSENGVVLNDQEDAISSEALKLKLQTRGFRVQTIRPAQIRSFWKKKVSTETFLLFNQEFLALLRAGLTVSDALALSLDHPGRGDFGQVLAQIYKLVHEGQLLSDACIQHPEVFDSLYIAALKTGEKTGELVTVLTRYQDYLRRQMLLQRKIKRAMAYPIFLLIILVVILAALFGFVMPRFVAMYASFDAALPAPTRVLLGIVQNLPLILLSALLIGGGTFFAWRAWRNTEKGRLIIDRWKANFPILGGIEQNMAVAKISRSLATMLGGGTTLLDALRTTQETLSNRLYARQLAMVTQKVTEGSSLAAAFAQSKIFPSTVIKMIQVGESSGALDKMLAEAAQYYEETLEDRLDTATTLIEPLLMLFMGVIVGSVIVVMYLPIFNLANVIR